MKRKGPPNNRSGLERDAPRSKTERHYRRDERTDRAHQAPEQGAFLYGTLPILERLRSRPGSVSKVFLLESANDHRLRDIVDLARKGGIVIERTTRNDLDRKVGSEANHQGVVAVTAAADFADVDRILDAMDEQTLAVVLDGLEDPRNFGAVLRSAECAGASAVFIPERRAVGLTETVAKSSAGALEHIPVGRVQNLNRLIEELKKKNVWVIGTSGDAETSYTDWDWTRPTALVLGNEGSGLHRLVAENCDMLVKIPMYGKIDSLNVSVAAGVILFEARRQRSISQ